MKSIWILAAAALPALSACGGKGAAAAHDSAGAQLVLGPQDLATAAVQALNSAAVISGNLDPAVVVQVRAQVPGTVDGVRVDRGTTVRRGSVLAVIDAQGIRSQAAGAEAQVSAAQAQVVVAKQRLEGAKRLLDEGAISAVEYKSAEATLQAAEAQVAAARAAAAGAGENAARATITSPIDGVVSARSVSGGEAVNPGTPLFTIVNASELELAGRIGVQDAARVRADQPVTFTLDAFPGQEFRGRVARLDPTADPGTRQVGVYVRLPNPGNRIVGGQYARGRIETGASQSTVVIPRAAIAELSGDSAMVFVLAGDHLTRRRVRVGATDAAAGVVAVLSGVRAGDRVVLNPSNLAEGVRVSVAAEAAQAGSPAAKK